MAAGSDVPASGRPGADRDGCGISSATSPIQNMARKIMELASSRHRQDEAKALPAAETFH
jgi:hypothetical protein